MKKIIAREELYSTILDSITSLCNPVGETLGPKGRNVIISKSDEIPFITNDGATIARCIESEDEIKNAIITIAKEAALKTEEEVGDGTSTTLVLLKEIIKEGINQLQNNVNPMVLKKELQKSQEQILKLLAQRKRNATNKELKNIALASANEEKIGLLVYEAYQKIKVKEAINIQESENSESFLVINYGYFLEEGLFSPYLLTEDFESKKVKVMICNLELFDIQLFSPILNEIIDQDQSLLILANDFSQEFLENVIMINKEIKGKILLVKNADYAIRRQEIMKDVAILSETTIINNLTNFNTLEVGQINLKVTNKEVWLIKESHSPKSLDYLQKLKEEALKTTDNYNKEFLLKRIAMFENGLATVYIGGNSQTEKRERLMRAKDALGALEVTRKGVLLGGGQTFYQLQTMLDDNLGNKIMKKVLKAPLLQILNNLGLDENVILKEITAQNFQVIYNYEKDCYENITETKIIDPYLVEQTALKNAISVAMMLLTTSYLIVNTWEKNGEETF